MKRFTLIAIVAALALAVACSDSSGPATGSATGVLVVGNTTFGSNLDADGYVVTVDGGNDKRIALHVGEYWTLEIGSHSVELTDIQGNCVTDENNGASTGPNPQSVTITARDTSLAWFAVACS